MQKVYKQRQLATQIEEKTKKKNLQNITEKINQFGLADNNNSLFVLRLNYLTDFCVICLKPVIVVVTVVAITTAAAAAAAVQLHCIATKITV